MKASFDSMKELNDSMKKQVRNLYSIQYIYIYIYIYTVYISSQVELYCHSATYVGI